MSACWLVFLFLVTQFRYALPTYSLPTYYYCYNYGHCNADAIEPISDVCLNCTCPAGTSGLECETAPNPCDSNPCSALPGNRICVGTIGTYYNCSCADGWTGPTCEMPISSICSSYPCLNGGTCIVDSSNINGFRCNCDSGRTGPRCQYWVQCWGGKCSTGSTCVQLYDGKDFKCNCPSGYVDTYCNVTSFTWGSRNAISDGSSQSWKYCWEANSILNTAVYQKTTDTSSNSPNFCENFMKGFGGTYTFFTISGPTCYASTTNYLNNTKNSQSCDCKCAGDCSGSKCGRNLANQVSCGCNQGSSYVAYVYQLSFTSTPPVCTSTSCGADLGHGTCVDMAGGTYKCICAQNWGGTDCSTYKLPCDSNPCQLGGTCHNTPDNYTYTCDCDLTVRYGPSCDWTYGCPVEPCENGGTCIEKGGQSPNYECKCLSFYIGQNCEQYDACWSSPCVYGTCALAGSGLATTYVCLCTPGYTGVNCETEIDECSLYSPPCNYGGTCHDYINYYNCTCIYGTEGQNCSINPNDCKPFTKNGHTYDNECVTMDPHAECVDGFGAFTCVCSPDYTDEFCDLQTIIWKVLIQLGGGKIDDDMKALLQELITSPSLIQDMVPFILGLEAASNRTLMSWDYNEMFQWVTYEEKTLDVTKELTKWNDVTLGNCFTFNHENSTTKYYARQPGTRGGFKAMLKLNQKEYLAWIDKASILVFITSLGDPVYSQSVRYNAAPNQRSDFMISPTFFQRLGGKYGECVEKTSEVKSYYSTGSYSTNGCLNSCYQDAIYKECDCMDPRYQYPEGVDLCGLAKRPCVERTATTLGDPSQWETCSCPQPCTDKSYTIQWSETNFLDEPLECRTKPTQADKDSCRNAYKYDNVMISIQLPNLSTQTFMETAKMDFNKFISNLGGLLGVLMGVSIISFIEVAFLILRLFFIIFSGR